MDYPIFQRLDEWRLPTPAAEGSPFTTAWSDTEHLLAHEIDMVRGTNPIIRIVASERDIRQDGRLRADARPTHRGVVVEFTHPSAGQLTYSCARYVDRWHHTRRQDWHHNARAIALSLEALRRVDRYGVTDRGQQYEGFKAIGDGAAVTEGSMTVEAAARYIAQHCGHDRSSEITGDPHFALGLYKEAARLNHPDLSGTDGRVFRRLTAARSVLLEDHDR